VPSPLAHALGATAIGWIVSRPAAPAPALVRQAAIVAAVGMAPDLDLLWGRHSQETHSIGAAVLVAAAAAWQRWPVAASRARIFLTIVAAWFSHSLFDGMSFDLGPPIGVMMWWPFSTEHWHTGLHVFGAIERHFEHDAFWRQNISSVVRELLILLPTVAGVWYLRKFQRH
jgi:hypothetical protein